MKIQLIFLIVCVVASFALPEGNRSANNQLSGQGDQRQEQENTDQALASVDDEQIDSEEENLDERTISSNETVTDGRKCKNNWKWRRHNRRYWLRREKEMRGVNSNDELNDGERRNPVTTDCQESQNERTGHEGSRHRNTHQRNSHHRHRHHENQANTTTPPQTTTISSNKPLVEPLQEIQIPTASPMVRVLKEELHT